MVATALAVLAGARADCRVRLEPIVTAVVLQLLDSATYRNHKTLLPGHVTSAEQAISCLAQLGPGAPDAIFQIAAHGTYGLYRRVRVRLTDLRFTDQQARTAGRAIRRLQRKGKSSGYYPRSAAFPASSASCSPHPLLTSAAQPTAILSST